MWKFNCSAIFEILYLPFVNFNQANPSVNLITKKNTATLIDVVMINVQVTNYLFSTFAESKIMWRHFLFNGFELANAVFAHPLATWLGTERERETKERDAIDNAIKCTRQLTRSTHWLVVPNDKTNSLLIFFNPFADGDHVAVMSTETVFLGFKNQTWLFRSISINHVYIFWFLKIQPRAARWIWSKTALTFSINRKQ